MIELTCQSCGEKVAVQGLLAAAEQPCSRCGQLLVGPLEKGRRITRPADRAATPWSEPRSRSSAGLWLGMLAGLVADPAIVAGIAHMDSALPWPVRNALLGALAGVLFTPLLIFTSFLSVILLPFSLEGLIGEGLWSRVAKALHERTLHPLAFPFLYFVAWSLPRLTSLPELK